MPTHIGQVIELPVDQVVTRQDHLSGGLGQALDKAQIQRVQSLLIKAGYPLQGGADGLVGRTTKKAVELVQGKINTFYKVSKVSVTGTPDATVMRELDSGNRAYLATDEDKKAVRALWTASTTSGGGLVVGGSPNVPVQGPTAPPATSGNVVDPMAPAAGAGIMAKYEEWLKKQPIPEFLKNPYVAAGVVTVGVAVVGYGLYRTFRSEPAPEAAMAGMTELEKMMREQGSREPYYTTDYKPKKPKKRRKIRKSKSKK